MEVFLAVHATALLAAVITDDGMSDVASPVGSDRSPVHGPEEPEGLQIRITRL